MWCSLWQLPQCDVTSLQASIALDQTCWQHYASACVELGLRVVLAAPAIDVNVSTVCMNRQQLRMKTSCVGTVQAPDSSAAITERLQAEVH